MSTIYNLIKSKSEYWTRHERDNCQSLIGTVLKNIDSRGDLRDPQREAIEVYLWIKFVGQNRKLFNIVKDGLLHDDAIVQEYDYSNNFDGNHVAQFLNQFFQDNDLQRMQKELLNSHENPDWQNFLAELLHEFDYPNYLFSLPMGAGKTFLMAAFIYLDLYFASLWRDDERFAHNFIILAPHAQKTSILPSLRTIEHFDPQWILPKDEAKKIKQKMTFEVLDHLSSQRRDKLHSQNQNLEKVNRARQTTDYGMVFVTNAEKVVLAKT